MIAISSIRPHSASAVYRENQVRAFRSWLPVFDRVIYFSKPEPELVGPRVEWVDVAEYPFIWQMAAWAAGQKELTVIINADIVVAPNLKTVLEGFSRSSFQAATSRRYDLESGTLNPHDRGLDIFVLKQRGWRMVAKLIPRSCRIGHNEWDSWMIGFMRKEFKKKFAEFTRCKCIFHPKHEERHRPFGETVDISGPYKGYGDGTPDAQILV